MKKSFLYLLISSISLLGYGQIMDAPVFLSPFVSNPSYKPVNDSIQMVSYFGNQNRNLQGINQYQLGLTATKGFEQKKVAIGIVFLQKNLGLLQNTSFYIPIIYKLKWHEAGCTNVSIAPGISRQNIHFNDLISTDSYDPIIQNENFKTNNFDVLLSSTTTLKKHQVGFTYQLTPNSPSYLWNVSYNYRVQWSKDLSWEPMLSLNHRLNWFIFQGVTYRKMFTIGLLAGNASTFGIQMAVNILPNLKLQYQNNLPKVTWLGNQHFLAISSTF